MDEFIKIIILSIIEGLTEFIPVSSTGHLIIASHLLNFDKSYTKLLEVFIQIGAVLAVIFYYKERISKVLKFFFSKSQREQRQAASFLWRIIIGCTPAVLAGAYFYKDIKAMFSINIVAYSLIAGGFVIILIEKLKPFSFFDNFEDASVLRILLIGIGQTASLIPGISRSGATIVSGMMCGLNRKAAAEFSFFLACPIILGAGILDLYKNWNIVNSHVFLMMLVGTLASFLSALIAIDVLLKIVQKYTLKPFAYYRIAAGILILVLLRAY